jgi:hypothetical protein
VIRTDRPYAFDLADAYNDAMPADTAKAMIWIVGQDGALKLVDRVAASEPKNFKPDQGETEWVKRATAEFLKRYPPQSGEPEHEVKLRLKRFMDHHGKSKPWLKTGEAA